jgi:geranylgeranyl reductase family protein
LSRNTSIHLKKEKWFDVIVVGGGPSGLLIASFLAETGLSVVVFDQNSEIGKHVVCSGVMSKEGFSRYDLPKKAILGGLKEADLFSPGGSCISYVHPEEAVVVVDRHIFDKELAEISIANGAEIWLNSRVSSLSVTDEYVEAILKSEEGDRKVFADVGVIATGVKYNLQSTLGLGRPKKVVKGLQVEILTENVERLRVYWGRRYSTGFFGWAIPLTEGRTRVGVMTEGHGMEGLNSILSEIGKYSEICPEGNGVKRRGIAFGTIPRSFSDRIVVIGEAAGQIKTTTGGGIYYGLLSAELASEVIGKAFKNGSFKAEILSEYERKWRKMLGKEIIVGEYLHKFYSKLSDQSLDELFVAAKKDGLLPYIANNGKFDWHTNAIIKIFRSPNLRRVLWNGFMG